MAIHVFTSAAANYIPKARVLGDSVRKHAPEARLSLLLAEPADSPFLAPIQEFDEVVSIENLEIPNFKSWLFQHDLVETCTAVKAFYLCKLLERDDCDGVLYFDPDVAVFSSLSSLMNPLANCSVLLTPHLLKHELSEDAVVDNELCTLKFGAFNLGFLGVNNNAEGRRFARWWRDRLHKYCFNDTGNNLFTDQRWADLVPAMFDDVHILKDYACNVATWNLTHRKVEGDLQQGFTVNGRPLIFYHYSGIDSGNQSLMLNKYGKDMPSLSILRNWYLEECHLKGDATPGDKSWHYGKFDNGFCINAEHRQTYKNNAAIQEKFPDPFATEGSSYLNYFDEKLECSSPPTSCRQDIEYEPLITIFEDGDNKSSSLETEEPAEKDEPGTTAETREIAAFFPIFDPEYYLETNPDVINSGIDPYVHYVLKGAAELRNPGPLFDASFYLQQTNSDEAPDNPLAHFVSQGWKEALKPHILFDTAFYFEQNADVRASGINPLDHFITAGWQQLRDPHPLFDVSFYLDQNPDVSESCINPLAHFIQRGAKEKRKHHPLFEPDYYLSENNLAADNPLEHFIREGAASNCRPHPLFDSQYYLAQLPETERKSAIKNPLLYFLKAKNSDFNPHSDFDMAFYREQNPDVVACGINPLIHYVTYGISEGRNPARPKMQFQAPALVASPPVSQIQLDTLKTKVMNGKPSVLFVGQADPGGTGTHIADLCRLLDGKANVLLLRPSTPNSTSRVQLSLLNSPERQVECTQIVEFDVNLQFGELSKFLQVLAVKRIHIHNLRENEHYLRRLIDSLAVPFDFTLHDYYLLSPLLHLTDETGKFAGEPDDGNAIIHLKGTEFQSDKFVSTNGMADWREKHAWVVDRAERLIAPSLDCKQRFRHFYPQKKVLAAYHPGANAVNTPIVVEKLAREQFLKVLVVGSIGNHKGAAVLEQCALLSRQKQLPIAFHLVGSSAYPLTTIPITELTVHGKYANEQLPERIAAIAPHLVWFPGQCAETFSYTFSEVCKLGLPVLVPAVGALPERAAGRDWSFVAPLNTNCEEWLNLFISIRNNHFLTGSAPNPYMRGCAAAAFDFYDAEYFSAFESMDERVSLSPAALAMTAPGKIK